LPKVTGVPPPEVFIVEIMSVSGLNQILSNFWYFERKI
jgi:hypothetical protein